LAYFAGTEAGTNYTGNATGADSALTLRSPTNLRGPSFLNTPDAGALTYKGVIPSVASFFGGVLPKKWNFIVYNRTNVTFSATESDHTKEYSGIYLTASDLLKDVPQGELIAKWEDGTFNELLAA